MNRSKGRAVFSRAACPIVYAAPALLGACSVTPYGASDADLARAKDHATSGAALFEAQCAECHGPRGEGRGAAPSLMGETALPRYPKRDAVAEAAYAGPEGQPRPLNSPDPEEARGQFASARDLESYLVGHMPKLKRQQLREEDYWEIVQFILIANGRAMPAEGLSPANGDQVSVQAR